MDDIAKFHQLQAQLCDRWRTIDHYDRSDQDVLVVPSLSLDQQELQKIQGVHHYEERLLFSLIRLRNPRTRLIYVTSRPLHPSVIDYYLELLPGIPGSHARDRLLLFCTYDSSLKSLTEKILERPRLMNRIRQALRLDRAYMTCFNSTAAERELAIQLKIPLLALDPELLHWGTKSGSRQIFAECRLPHPDGSPLVWNAKDLALEIVNLRQRQPQLQRMVVKLNQGFSGEGNALLDLRQLPADYPASSELLADQAERIQAHLPHLRFQSPTETWSHFEQRIHELGAIVEAFVEGEEKRSPSVQGRITPAGEVEILSTHDQRLGGPDGQVFLGCSFPADDAYRLQLQEMGHRVGQNLATKGVLERFSVDFIATRHYDSDSKTVSQDISKTSSKKSHTWTLYAIEINIRKGGTTHPFMALKLLTNGNYNQATGLFHNQQEQPKYYIATDNLQKDCYKGLLPSDLMDIVAYHQLHFNAITETGTIFHLMGCLSEFGKLGLTSIGNSPTEAEVIYEKVVRVLDQETQSSTQRDRINFPQPPMTWQ